MASRKPPSLRLPTSAILGLGSQTPRPPAPIRLPTSAILGLGTQAGAPPPSSSPLIAPNVGGALTGPDPAQYQQWLKDVAAELGRRAAAAAPTDSAYIAAIARLANARDQRVNADILGQSQADTDFQTFKERQTPAQQLELANAAQAANRQGLLQSSVLGQREGLIRTNFANALTDATTNYGRQKDARTADQNQALSDYNDQSTAALADAIQRQLKQDADLGANNQLAPNAVAPSPSPAAVPVAAGGSPATPPTTATVTPILPAGAPIRPGEFPRPGTALPTGGTVPYPNTGAAAGSGAVGFGGSPTQQAIDARSRAHGGSPTVVYIHGKKYHRYPDGFEVPA